MFYFFVEIVFFLWLYAVVIKREAVFRFNIVTGAFLLFVVAVVLSAVFGVDTELSFWSNFERMNGALTWLHIGAFFVVATSVFHSKKDWLHLFWVNGVAATITAAIALLGRDGLEIMNISEKGGSLIGNTSFVGSYLLISFFFLLYIWIKKYKNRGLVSAMMLVFLVSPIFFGAKIWDGQVGLFEAFGDPIIFLGRARAATFSLYLGFGAFILGGIYLVTKKKFLKTTSAAALGAVAIFSLSTIIMFFVPNSPVQNFISSEASKSRVGAWEIAVDGWKTRPLLGYGVGAFSYVYQEFYNPLFLTKEYGSETWMDQAHSVGYEILATTGLLGALTFVFMYISAISFVWILYRKEKIGFWEAMLPTVVIVVHLIQNLTVFDTITTYQLFALMFAFPASLAGREYQPSINTQSLKYAGQAVLGSGLILSSVFFVFVPLSSSHATLSFSKGDFLDSQEKIDKLFNRIDSTPIGRTEKVKLLSELWREQSVRHPQIFVTYAENVLHIHDSFMLKMKESLEKHPNDLRTHVTISRMGIFTASLLEASQQEKFDGYIADAEYHAVRSLEISPNSQMALWAMAAVENVKGNKDQAYLLAKEAYDLAPTALNAEAILNQYE